MKNISLDLKNVYGFVPKAKIDGFKPQSEAANLALRTKTGKGSDFLGWVDLPGSISKLNCLISKTVQKLQVKHLEVFVVIGIGGSYLGSKAVIDALSDSLLPSKDLSKPRSSSSPDKISAKIIFSNCVICSKPKIGPVLHLKIRNNHRACPCLQVTKQDLERNMASKKPAKELLQ